MGWYINPPSQSKESWLLDRDEPTTKPGQITETHLPVCLVNNGPFTAAAVCPNERELAEFAREDGRPKVWFQISRRDLADHGFFKE